MHAVSVLHSRIRCKGCSCTRLARTSGFRTAPHGTRRRSVSGTRPTTCVSPEILVVCKRREDGKGSAGKPDLVGEIQHHGVFCDPDAANLARTEPNYRIGDACESGPAAILCSSPSNTGAQFSGIDSPGNGHPGIVNRSLIVIAGPKRAASPETGSNQELKIARKTRTSKLATMTRTVQRTNPTKVASCAEMFIVPCSCSAIVPAPLTPECRLIGLRFAVKHLRNAGSS